MNETVSVDVTVLAIDRVDEGRLIAFASVEIDVDGVLIGLEGVRLVRQPPSRINIEAPRYRRGGAWLPAVVFPAELSRAIAAAVFAAYDERDGP
jgi:hypothetical protein